MTERIPEHLAVWERFRRVFGGGAPARPGRDARRREQAEQHGSSPFSVGRDPRGVEDVLSQLSRDFGWESPLARGRLIQNWPELVGEQVAAHTDPVGVEGGELVVRCDSTAWAQQLRMLRSTVLARIEELHPAAGIERLRFLGPDAPSFKRGPRSVPGRGPRDTYG